MVNPGAFTGSCKTYLLSLKQYYATAVNEGYAPEAISSIQRRYFKRYPVDLPHDEEPSDEHLAAVDDDAADPEPEGPIADVLTVEEYVEALKKWEDRQKSVIFRKAQIKRWFAYQFMKDSDLDSTQSGLFNPYHALLAKLTGKKINAPHLHTAANTWRKTQREAIEEEVKRRVAAKQDEPLEEGAKKESLITLRDRVAREMFKKLSHDEQVGWKKQADQDHAEAVKAWKVEMEAKPATDPRSRQLAIQGLVKFMQPILDLVCGATGWKASFIAGGPEPAEGGLLNILSIHSGTMPGDVKLSFGRSERRRFRKTVVPMYGKFLQNCYTPVECRSQALPKEEGFLPMANLDLENEGASVDLVSDLSASPPPILLPVGSASAPATSTPAGRAASSAVSTSTNSSATVPAAVSAPPTVPLPTSASKTLSIPAAAVPTAAFVPPAGSLATSATSAPAKSPIATAAEMPAPVNTAVVPPAALNPADVGTMDETSARADKSNAGTHGVTEVQKKGPAAESDIQMGQEGEVEQDSDMEAYNPFPFDIPGESSPPPMPMQEMSRNPTPLVSPCPSPPPSPSSAPCMTTPVSEESSTVILPVSEDGVGPQPVIKTAGACRSKRTTKPGGSANAAGQAGKGVRKCKSSEIETSVVGSSPTPASKKARTRNSAKTTATSSDIGFKVPDDAPQWFKKALIMLSSTDLGAEWKGVVEAWGRFESVSSYKEVSNLGAEHRPLAVKDWIQRARSHTWRPKIVDFAVYEEQFRRWWVGLQPQWHVAEEGRLLKSSDGDWELLRRPGVNGLRSVATSLFFWGSALRNADAAMAQWVSAVEDFRFVLSCLVV